ncbi:DUF3276 family protein [Marinilabiliaceae bacterium ANBcel2]|nr:DUF3276 family protein [Marinilabiliaceae bacterium ANBcel2]
MEGFDKNDGFGKNEKEEIFSKVVRAGKRTYFFDVKATRKNDYYLTLTESKKKFEEDGRFYFEKHKIFLYKEDFDKFIDGLQESVDFIKKAKGMFDDENKDENYGEKKENSEEYATSDVSKEYTDIEFEDLNK